MKAENYKVCSKCKETKHLSMFFSDRSARGGKKADCKDCYKIYSKSVRARRSEGERKRLASLSIEKKAMLYKARVERLRAYYIENAERIKKSSAEYYLNNKDLVNKNRSERRKILRATNPEFYIKERISCLIRIGIKRRSATKRGSVWGKLGYSAMDLKLHLESKFLPGMSWENRDEWHIDHIIPQSYFRFTNTEDEEFKQCWSIDNLRPLWAADNIRKSNKIHNSIQIDRQDFSAVAPALNRP